LDGHKNLDFLFSHTHKKMNAIIIWKLMMFFFFLFYFFLFICVWPNKGSKTLCPPKNYSKHITVIKFFHIILYLFLGKPIILFKKKNAFLWWAIFISSPPHNLDSPQPKYTSCLLLRLLFNLQSLLSILSSSLLTLLTSSKSGVKSEI